jgi:DNA-binding protein H-NS
MILSVMPSIAIPDHAAEGNQPMKLKSLSLERLTEVRDRVEAALTSKVADERRNLQAALSRLSKISAGGAQARSSHRPPLGTIAPKYRNPENPAETWAGRGLKPRWLTAALNTGKKLEAFSLNAQGKSVSLKKVRIAKKAPKRSFAKKATRKDSAPERPKKEHTIKKAGAVSGKTQLAVAALPPQLEPAPESQVELSISTAEQA